MPRGPFSYTAQWGRGLCFATRFTTMVMNETTTKIFPYLERLLDGEEVEWKTLGEVAELYAGLSGKNKEHFQKGNAPYVTYKNIFENLAVDSSILEMVSIEADERQHAIKYGDILITGSSENIEEVGMASVVTFHPETEIYLNSFSFGIRFHSAIQLSPEFTKYLFRSDLLRKQIMKTASGVTRFNVSKKKFLAITLPVPPLRVQARIVEILDKFTQLEAQLEAELQAELEARRKQYAYYRDQLLNFSQYSPLNVNIEWKTLGEIMEIVTDFTAAGSFASNAQNVRYLQEPNYALLVRTTDIKQGFKATDKFVYVDQHAFEYLWRVNLDKECIILPNVGNCGEVYHSSPSILPYTKCVLGPNAILVRSEKVSNKFLFYLFQAAYFQKELAKITSTAGQGKFNKTNLKQINLPIPPLSEQRRIVDILDHFDTLTNSISEGLPKEIALRRKQYAYYRDALLSFPRPEVSA